MSKIMLALGGNALGNSPEEQIELVKETSKPIVDLIEEGHTVVIAHGNGPQVGMINSTFQEEMPFPECGAMSQGYIGYHLQNAISNELRKRKIEKSVITLVSQVIVDEDDEAFNNPSKPIGKFYSQEEAEKLAKEKNYTMIEDAGRGFRRVVPSPIPVDIVEKDVIKDTMDKGHVVIAVGGGGIPTIIKDGQLKGVAAVIDKDFASGKLAEILDCDLLVILTSVKRVSINYGKENQMDFDKLTLAQAERYIEEEQFAKGSMLPKVKAAIKFVQSKEGRKSIIASLEDAKEAINQRAGTIITH